MDELAFEATAAETEPAPAIEASNCVYHELAVSHPEICPFDIALIARLTGQDVQHTACRTASTRP